MLSDLARRHLTTALANKGAADEILDEIDKLGFPAASGNHYYVDSGAGNNGFTGKSWAQAFADLNTAVAACTANNGDVIHVAAGHVEDLAAAETIDFDVAGITVIGYGNGPDRPRIDYNAADAAVDIGANGVTLYNLTFRPSVATVAIGVDVEAGVTDTAIINCQFLNGEDGAGADEFVLGIDVKAGCHRTLIDGVKYSHHASCDGANAGISLTGASDEVVIRNCDIDVRGTAAVAPVKGITTLSTRVRIENCTLVSDAEPGIELLTGTTGVIAGNRIFSNLATVAAAIVADGCALFENYYVEVGNEAGALIGTASAND